MLDKIKRKEVPRQDRQVPQSFEQLVQQYDLDKVWDYIDKIIDEINRKEG